MQKTTPFTYSLNPYPKRVTATICKHPFGMLMPWRTYSSEAYSWGFNGQEKDNEISSEGNSYTAEYWQYDSRLGRRWNVDPIYKHYESPYCAFANNPIWIVDVNGADSTVYLYQTNSNLTPKEYDKYKESLKKDLKRNGLGGYKIVDAQGPKYDTDETDINMELYYSKGVGTERATSRGYTEPGGKFTHVNVAYYESKLLPLNTRGAANTGTHEICHALLKKAKAFYNVTNEQLGLDNEEHSNTKINLMTEGNARELKSPVKDSDPEQFKVSELLLNKHAFMIRCYLNVSGHVGCTESEKKMMREVLLKNVKSLKNPNGYVPK